MKRCERGLRSALKNTLTLSRSNMDVNLWCGDTNSTIFHPPHHRVAIFFLL